METAAAPPPSAWGPFDGASDFVKNIAISLAGLTCVLSFGLAIGAVIRHILLRRRRIRQLPTHASASESDKPSAEKGAFPPSEHLPTLAFSAGSGFSTDCAVCLVDFADGDAVGVLPNCGHGFHVECIGPWISSRRSCPTCRKTFPPVETRSPEDCAPEVV